MVFWVRSFVYFLKLKQGLSVFCQFQFQYSNQSGRQIRKFALIRPQLPWRKLIIGRDQVIARRFKGHGVTNHVAVMLHSIHAFHVTLREAGWRRESLQAVSSCRIVLDYGM